MACFKNVHKARHYSRSWRQWVAQYSKTLQCLFDEFRMSQYLVSWAYAWRACFCPKDLRLLQRTPSPLWTRPASLWSGRHPGTREAEETSPTASTAGSAPVTAGSVRRVGAAFILFLDSLASRQPPCWSPTFSQTPTTASPLRARMECPT